ncbi:hypothetical protein MBLNU459_g1921t2 [Dothideomycetes sp. NU459]
MQSRSNHHCVSSPPPPAPAPSQKLSRSKTSPATALLHTPKHVFEPQLSERDSIFATSYNTLDVDSPVNTPGQPPPPEGDGVSHPRPHLQLHQTREDSGVDTTMAASPTRTSMTDLSRLFHADAHPSVDASHFYDRLPSGPLPAPVRSESPTQQQHRPQHAASFDRRTPRKPLPTNALSYTSPYAIPNAVATSDRPATPASDPDSQLRSFDDLQSSVERSQYRSWREGKGKMSGKTIAESQGRKNSAEAATDVDRKIDAKLPKQEQGVNVRSRKTSHYLGLFKDDESEKRRADEKDKAKDKAKEVDLVKELTPINEARGDSVTANQPRPHQNNDSFASADHLQQEQHRFLDSGAAAQQQARIDSRTSPNSNENCHSAPNVDASAAADGSTETQISHQIPPRLLEEIRNHHIIPGAGKDASANKKQQPNVAAQENGVGTFEFKKGGIQEDAPKASLLTRQAQVGNDISREQEEDESDQEQISSAQYIPHQKKGPKGPSALSTPSVQEESKQIILPADQSDFPKPADFTLLRAPLKDAIEAGGSALPSNVEIQLLSADESQVLQGEIPISRKTSEQSDNDFQVPSSSDAHASGSDYESDASAQSYGSAFEDDDDEDLTPTATPTAPSTFNGRLPSPRQTLEQEPAQIGAVELKPYNHQVGGHSTVYSFSRQAVCKQLNSKENEFYETVEQHHPELLDFLPRYIGVLNVTYKKPSKKRKTDGTKAARRASLEERGQQHSDVVKPGNDEDHPRVISHSMSAQNNAVPESGLRQPYQITFAGSADRAALTP